jgi:hypothetical protein
MAPVAVAANRNRNKWRFVAPGLDLFWRKFTAEKRRVSFRYTERKARKGELCTT